MKRILFISPTGTLDNGAERSILNFMIFLSNNGYEVLNVFPDNKHETATTYRYELRKHGIVDLPFATLKWWWEEAPGGLHLSHQDRVLFYQQNIYELRQIIRRKKVDLVITNTVNLFQGSVAAACEDIPHFWLIHEFPAGEFSYYKEKLSFITEMSDVIFVASDALRIKLSELSENDKQVQTFIPYTEISTANLQESGERRIVSIGTVNFNKNQLELLHAYRRLNNPNLSLIFIGGWDKSYKEVCDSYIKDNQLSRVEFLGNKERPWDFVTTSDLCVLNSKMEVFSLVCIEAILNAVPVVASNNPGYMSVLDYFDTGTLYDLGDIDGLACQIKEQLDHFLEKKALALKIAENAKSKYNLEHSYLSIMQSIEQLTYKRKSLHSIKCFLGDQNLYYLTSKIHKKVIMVFYRFIDTDFTPQCSLQFDLCCNDKIEFHIPKYVEEIRIDLAEFPGFFKEVRLIARRTNTVLLPKYTNAFMDGDTYLFDTHDPQIIYSLRGGFYGNEFVLCYESFEMIDSISEEYVGSVLTRKLSALTDHSIQYQTEVRALAKEKKSLQKELQHMTMKYHFVIGSRRWKISTTIINFFRRKK